VRVSRKDVIPEEGPSQGNQGDEGENISRPYGKRESPIEWEMYGRGKTGAGEGGKDKGYQKGVRWNEITTI